MSLILSQISYTYEPGTPMETAGLVSVSLEIRPGEFLGIIGHTGSGKSTLIQTMNGLIRPTAGTVSLDGEDVFAECYDRRKLRARIGLVFQYPEYQLFETDVFTDVCFGPRNLGLPEEVIKRRAREALERVGLGTAYDARSPFELSGGEKRRAAIAGILAMEPEILILDEPTAGLDPAGREDLLRCLKSLQKEKGMGIVLVSHSMEDVACNADRIAVMHEGRLAMLGTPREVFSRSEELTAMGLAVPEVSRILGLLKSKGFAVDPAALTMDEAEEAILKCLR